MIFVAIWNNCKKKKTTSIFSKLVAQIKASEEVTDAET